MTDIGRTIGIGFVVVASFVMAACTTLPEETQFQREDKLIAAREEFSQKRVSCKSSGGAMVIRTNGSRIKRNTHDQYKGAKCTAW